MAILDWSQCPAVESVPGKLSGMRVLKGTRMPVWEQVKTVIAFAARSLEKTPAFAA